MYIPKKYGYSKSQNCPFCEKIATTENSQGVPVCLDHKKENLQSLKCVCGEYLDIRKGKFGPYFHCMNCGNINFKKGLEMNPNISRPTPKKEHAPKETTITSEEVDLYY